MKLELERDHIRNTLEEVEGGRLYRRVRWKMRWMVKRDHCLI